MTAALAARPALAAAPAARAAPKVLRYAFQVAETGFDPAQVTDVYSATVIAHIFESLYTYDYLARPARIVPLTAAALPEVSADWRTWTMRVRPGIHFAADPAFGGRPRELVAADYRYAILRFADPAVKAPRWPTLDEWQLAGVAEERERALRQRRPFDYDADFEGLRVLDRYTLQLRLGVTRPRFVEELAGNQTFGAVAREVAQAWGERIAEHPVGTGPFRLARWRRSSLIVLERNPGYRARLWDATPAADDAEGQAIAARLRGRRLPLIDRVEVSIIEEAQPRWLAFLGGEADLVDRLPPEFADAAMPGGRVAPYLARQGVRGARVLPPNIAFTYFNMDDPLVGGLAPERVALRRAIGLGVDIEREIRVARHGMAIPAQGPILPGTNGYDPAFRSEMSRHDPARAQALLELYGWRDRDGDGWRERPDGGPLRLEIATQPDGLSRRLNELWQRNMRAIGIRVAFKSAQWPENLKAARAGRLMMWSVGSVATQVDGQDILGRYYGPLIQQQNYAHFSLPAMDAIYERLSVLPDGAERAALFRQAQRLAVAYMPYKLHCHLYVADLVRPQLVGYRRPMFGYEWWHMVDLDGAARGARA
ncbi:MAG: bicyclomycin resistance protein [Burkholderiales bacterium]|nr:bicyclomycin resistance protein [Burkholderiales bacterium]MDE2505466.1 bicyclomycin resistance protein [Burkholderiales bacterium]